VSGTSGFVWLASFDAQRGQMFGGFTSEKASGVGLDEDEMVILPPDEVCDVGGATGNGDGV